MGVVIIVQIIDLKQYLTYTFVSRIKSIVDLIEVFSYSYTECCTNLEGSRGLEDTKKVVAF